jgi:hypothetical protein
MLNLDYKNTCHIITDEGGCCCGIHEGILHGIACPLGGGAHDITCPARGGPYGICARNPGHTPRGGHIRGCPEEPPHGTTHAWLLSVPYTKTNRLMVMILNLI